MLVGLSNDGVAMLMAINQGVPLVYISPRAPVLTRHIPAGSASDRNRD